MATSWYCQLDGQERGPFSADKLRELAAKGRIAPQTRVRRGAEGQWVLASSVSGLFEAGQGAAVPSAPGTHAPAPKPPPVPRAAAAPPPPPAANKPLPRALPVDPATRGGAPIPRAASVAPASPRPSVLEQRGYRGGDNTLLYAGVGVGVLAVVSAVGIGAYMMSSNRPDGRPAASASPAPTAGRGSPAATSPADRTSALATNPAVPTPADAASSNKAPAGPLEVVRSISKWSEAPSTILSRGSAKVMVSAAWYTKNPMHAQRGPRVVQTQPAASGADLAIFGAPAPELGGGGNTDVPLEYRETGMIPAGTTPDGTPLRYLALEIRLTNRSNAGKLAYTSWGASLAAKTADAPILVDSSGKLCEPAIVSENASSPPRPTILPPGQIISDVLVFKVPVEFKFVRLALPASAVGLSSHYAFEYPRDMVSDGPGLAPPRVEALAGPNAAPAPNLEFKPGEPAGDAAIGGDVPKPAPPGERDFTDRPATAEELRRLLGEPPAPEAAPKPGGDAPMPDKPAPSPQKPPDEPDKPAPSPQKPPDEPDKPVATPPKPTAEED